MSLTTYWLCLPAIDIKCIYRGTAPFWSSAGTFAHTLYLESYSSTAIQTEAARHTKGARGLRPPGEDVLLQILSQSKSNFSLGSPRPYKPRHHV